MTGDLPCNELVEMVTDYLEGTLPAPERDRVDRHLTTCDGCQTVLAQWREVVRLTGRLAETEVDQVDGATRDQLMRSFRRLRRD